MTQGRRPNIQQHSARPDKTEAAAQTITQENEEEKIEYIEFINKLMHRMRMDGVKAMLDHALELTD